MKMKLKNTEIQLLNVQIIPRRKNDNHKKTSFIYK